MPRQIQITGLKELNGFLTGLDKNLRKEIGKEGFQFMKDVAKTARFKAPKNTGGLRDSINVRQEKKGLWVLTVESPHGVFQEEGFKPHPIHRSMIAGNEGQEGFVIVRKNTPFVAPALEHHLSALSTRLNNAVDRALGEK